jgi:broad specificity phosphatase PhoE
MNSFTDIYSSDLTRAMDTAQISLGFPNRKIKL